MSNSHREAGQRNHDHNIQGKKIATVAWMIIFEDELHNFTDGLSMEELLSMKVRNQYLSVKSFYMNWETDLLTTAI